MASGKKFSATTRVEDLNEQPADVLSARPRPGDERRIFPHVGGRRLPLYIGVASIVGSLVGGCALNKEATWASNVAQPAPTVRPLNLVIRSAETPDAYYVLGKYYFWQNRFEQSRAAFEQAARLRPNNAEVLNGLGAVYDKLGQYEGAQRAYQAALVKSPQAAHIWANLGYSLLLQGRAHDAVAALDKAAALNPADAVARGHLAQAKAEEAKQVAMLKDTQAKTDQAQMTPPPVPASEPAEAAQTVAQVTAADAASTAANTTNGATPHALPDVAKGGEAHGVIENRVAAEATAITAESAAEATVIVAESAAEATVITAESAAEATVIVAESAAESPTVVSAANAPDIARQPLRPAEHATLGSVRIEVSNGNGVTGMARGVSANMRAEGVRVARITNSRPFNTARSAIIYPAGMEERAAEIGRMLPAAPRMVAGSSAHRNVDVRVILGADAVPNAPDIARQPLRPAEHVTLLGSVRIEVSNGNGVTGMARGVSANMRAEGVHVARITNSRPFNTARSVIIYPAGMEERAAEIGRMLPVAPRMVAGSSAHRNVHVRVILGADAVLAWKEGNKKTVLAMASGK